jgi:hypothetical protein
MLRRTIIRLVAVGALLSSQLVTSAQSQTPGWGKCPDCQTVAEVTAARAKTANAPFDPRDLSGVWNEGNGNRNQLSTPAPPLTAEGKERYEATRAEESADGTQLSNSKDGMLVCDPLGWPRWFTYNFGFEFVQLPNRMIQFFEFYHTWRTIWTDGRTLPENPDPRWLGYSVGRWEGDTFIVESNGFDERSWLSENRQDRRWGWPHSEEMRIRETYRRVNHNTIEATVTITDPKTYTKPWVTVASILRSPDAELSEYFCVPSDSQHYNATVLRPAVTGQR